MTEDRNPVLTEAVASRLLLIPALGEALFMLTSIALKLSLLIFFRQFVLERKQRNVMTYVTAVYCVMSAIGIFLALFPCGALVHLAKKRVNGHTFGLDLRPLAETGAMEIIHDCEEKVGRFIADALRRLWIAVRAPEDDIHWYPTL
ncbi:hypothetical protein KCU62_g3980, partial [Aureobasidium sp. EXF-3399]